MFDETFGYAQRHGFSLLRLRPQKKAPVEPDWQHRASGDRADWERWATTGHNVGIHAGASGIATADIEAGRWEIARTWFKTELGLDIPEPHVSSARKGWHIFFRLPPDIGEVEKKKFPWGELIAGFNQTVAPGSYFDGSDEGKESGWYQFFDANRAPYDAPEKLVALIKKGDRPNNHVEPSVGDFSRYEIEDVMALARFLNAHGHFVEHDEWCEFGMAAKHDMGEAGRAVWAEIHDGTVTPNVEASKWRSFKDTDNPVTLRSFLKKARELGWTGHLRKTVQWMFRDALVGTHQQAAFVYNGPVPGPAPADEEDWGGEPLSGALPLTYFDDCAKPISLKWIFKNFLALGFNVSFFGAPGSRKTTLVTDIIVHAAGGQDWRGFKSKGAVGVVYFCFERASQVRRLLAAHAIRDELKDLPIAVCDTLINLCSPSCVEIVTSTIHEAEAHMRVPVGLIVFDTWSKGIAAGGGDEDRAKEQNIIAANLKRIHEAAEICIVGIGHSGKDEARGERGSNARQGDVDLQIKIAGDAATKTATTVKANELLEGDLTSFTFETIQLGHDEDGDAITASIVSRRQVTAAKPPGRASDRQELAMRSLARVCVERGQAVTVAPGMQVKAAAVEDWREELFRDGVLERDAPNPREPFRRLKTALASAGLISERDGLIWPVRANLNMPPFPPARR